MVSRGEETVTASKGGWGLRMHNYRIILYGKEPLKVI